MKIIFLEWDSYCNLDMIEAFEKTGCEVSRIPFSTHSDSPDYFPEGKMDAIVAQTSIDFIFSFNYFPRISGYCKEKGIKYVSWVYDNPHVDLYSCTILNDCNYVFVFDRTMYQEFQAQGIKTVYYLPLAVNTKRLDRIKISEANKKLLTSDISFVGSLYTEPKHNLYAKYDEMSHYFKGYLDAAIRMQLKLYGYDLIRELLTEEVMDEMKRVHPLPKNPYGVETDAFLYGDCVLLRRVTAVERKEIIEMLSEKHDVKLFTIDRSAKVGKSVNFGGVDYYNGMPYVFKTAKINLNITLRSIRTGIPLRALDIMGCKGFLLTNYQEEMPDYFVPDEDFVYYSDYEDLDEKAAFYLKHETERKQISENGYKKVKQYFSFEERVREMMETIR